jgi:hypothetical protein
MMMQQKVMGGGANKLLELLFDTDFRDTSPLNSTPNTSAGAQSVNAGKCVFSDNGSSIGLQYSPIGTINPYALSFSDGTKDLPFTYKADINISSWNANNGTTLIGNDTANSNGNRVWSMYFTPTDLYVSFFNYNDKSQYFSKRFTFSTLLLSTNYSLKVTSDGTATMGGVKLWINDVEITSYINSTVGIYTRMNYTNQSINLGGIYFAGGYDFRGTMDNIIIYDKVV